MAHRNDYTGACPTLQGSPAARRVRGGGGRITDVAGGVVVRTLRGALELGRWIDGRAGEVPGRYRPSLMDGGIVVAHSGDHRLSRGCVADATCPNNPRSAISRPPAPHRPKAGLRETPCGSRQPWAPAVGSARPITLRSLVPPNSEEPRLRGRASG